MHAFTPSQRSKLLANRNVLNVTEKSVSYTSDFKIKAVHECLAGVSPDQIFQDAGIPIIYFKKNYCKFCLKKWIYKFRTRGEDSLYKDGRGSGGSGRPKNERPEELTYDELLTLVEIQKGALEELKKQNALERKKKR
jgi:transposase